MKNIFKSLLAAALIVAPAASYGQDFTGKTLKKTFVASTAADAPAGPSPASIMDSLINEVTTPCYAIDLASNLDDLITVGLFLGTGAGDSDPVLDAQALGSTLIALSLLENGFDEPTIYAFLLAQLRFIYDC